MKKLKIAVFLSVFSVFLFMQESPAIMQEKVEAKTVATTPVAPALAEETVAAVPTTILLLINEAKPYQVIAFDQNGEWLSGVKEISIKMDVGASTIVADYVSWKGVLRPTNPQKHNAVVKEIKSVKEEVFQDQLSKLNE